MHSTPQPAPPAALERLGRYRIVRPLSKGGMALVYEARRESLAGVSPRVAIKLILPEYTDSDTFQELFINEARLGASLHHQNLVQIQDFDQDGERFFLVMEYVEGITLRRAISLCRRNTVHVPVGVIAEVGRQACDGLAYAHSASDEDGEHLGLIHRDVKPSNLILNPQGVVKLVDFGISKGFRLVEKRGTVKGTWGYMAHEQANGQEVGPGTDVFGLATVLFEMATRTPMFPDKKPDTVKRLLAQDHPIKRLAELDGSYLALMEPLQRALQKNPRDRYTDAAEFGRALSASLPDPISARDEVVRFYGGVDALHRGLPIPEGTLASSSSVSAIDGAAAISIGGPALPPPPVPDDEGSMLWIVGAVTGLGVIGTVVLMVVLLVAMPEGTFSSVVDEPSLGDLVVEPVVPDPEPRRALDEPSGPAGVGAPGEDIPPPVAERTDPQRRPPPSSIPVVEPGSVVPVPDAQPEPQPVVDEAVAQPEAQPERVVVVRRAPEPEAEVEVQPPTADPEPEVVTPPPAEDATPALLTIGARQPAEVYIDGRYVRKVPLMNRELTPGPHVITIQALDGRKKVFEVDLAPGQELRRVWDFERSEWRP